MDAKRVRFLAISALSGFETLDRDEATEGAALDLLDILEDVASDPEAVALVARIKALFGFEFVASDVKVADLVEG